MQGFAGGSPFHAEFTSSDASTPANEAAARMTIYGAQSATAVALDTNDQVIITDLRVLCGGTGLTVYVFDGSDTTVDNGERISQGTYAANGGEFQAMQTPYYCQKGKYPKVKTSGAGQIDVIARGVIVRKGV